MKKVLIVEDETVVREKIIEAIDWSQDIVLAGAVENGAEALKICEQVMPEIAFVDIQMPVMDGITLTAKLKEKNPHLKVVLLTAYSEFNYARKAIELNVEKYVLK
ncbi:response regulator, partial [Hungatella sp.]